MRLGIDFGTTRTTVAVADRGNYPLLAFPDRNSDAREYIPSIVALSDSGPVYGFEAASLALKGAPHLRSFKRLLSRADVNQNAEVELGSLTIPLIDVVSGFLTHVAKSVRSAVKPARGKLEAVVGIPAHAHSAQRLITLEAFRRAGIDVVAMINEPSAAGFEYTHRLTKSLNSRRTRILVYDLGGGTFDASLVAADDKSHEVLGSRGDNNFGGDDFDVALASFALEKSGRGELAADEWQRLLDSARQAKESLYPQSRYVAVDVPGASSPTSIPVKEFYDLVAPLIESTLATMEPLLAQDEGGASKLPDDVAGLYVVGGGYEVPAVGLTLRCMYVRRVPRSHYSAGSTAIGLAIAADPSAGYTLTDRLARGVGVFRDREGGSVISFDPLLGSEQRVSPNEDVTVVRTYRAAHNVGWYRFVEYTRTDADGVPRGEVVPCGTLAFPFDPALRGGEVDVDDVEVQRTGDGPLIEERYTVDRHGIVEVSIRDVESGYEVTRSLGAR